MAIVAAHDVRPAHQHLAVGGDFYFDSFEWFADRADAIVLGAIGAHDAGFGHAIALQDLDTCAQKRIREGWRKRRTARDKVA